MRILSVFAVVAAIVACAGATAHHHDEIINDFDSAGVIGEGWGEAWYTPCNDGYGHQQPVDFHMDWAGEHGLVTAAYHPVLPAPGCYEVFEWHPGQNPGCAVYMPTNALMTVHHAGMTTDINVDQSVNASQWNSLGRFDLQPGQPAFVVASNRGGDMECGASVCWWVADAVRFTWVDESCEASSSTAVHDAQQQQAEAACAGFIEGLDDAVAACSAVDSCETMMASEACTAAAASFNREFEERLLECMLLPDVLEGMQAAPESYAGMRLITTCAVEHEAQGAAEAALQTRDVATTVSSGGLSAAIAWDGKCEHFQSFAMEVMLACSGITCCADVMADDTCAYYANGLYSLFPNEAFNSCIDQVDIPCTCLLRKATACALQGETHKILYREKWEPDCVDEIMPFQHTPDDSNDSYSCAVFLLSLLVGVSFGGGLALWCASKHRSALQPMPVAVEVHTEFSDKAIPPVAILAVVQNPDGKLVIGQPLGA